MWQNVANNKSVIGIYFLQIIVHWLKFNAHLPDVFMKFLLVADVDVEKSMFFLNLKSKIS